ncbi:MAG: ADP-ribosylglycohydrolase family protein [Ignavibacterium sp.]|nr:ADP-ribosylglycohydrolase family protein [Ignavibacterium sp.]
MLGAITGDIVGSVYEFTDVKPEFNFPLFSPESEFTDDTVLTVALADSILSNLDYKVKLSEYYQLYPDCSYGLRFHEWANSNNPQPYNSWGNGSAMRVSPIGWAYNDLDTVLLKAKESSQVTHNHPEGIKGAQATAASIFLARTGASKFQIKEYIQENFNYNLNFDLEELRKHYRFNESCQQTVPQAIYTFLVSDSFEDSIRKAIYIGGDSDTLACINGSIAEAFYGGVPEEIKIEVYKRMDNWITKITNNFIEKFNTR